MVRATECSTQESVIEEQQASISIVPPFHFVSFISFTLFSFFFFFPLSVKILLPAAVVGWPRGAHVVGGHPGHSRHPLHSLHRRSGPVLGVLLAIEESTRFGVLVLWVRPLCRVRLFVPARHFFSNDFLSLHKCCRFNLIFLGYYDYTTFAIGKI